MVVAIRPFVHVIVSCKALALLLILLIMVVSLGCGARVQAEAHRETNSLHAYVGNVEAAAAGLLSCVQELEHLLTLCTYTPFFPLALFFPQLLQTAVVRSQIHFQLPNYEFHHNFELVQFTWKKDFFHRDFFTTKSLHNKPINVDSFCC